MLHEAARLGDSMRYGFFGSVYIHVDSALLFTIEYIPVYMICVCVFIGNKFSPLGSLKAFGGGGIVVRMCRWLLHHASVFFQASPL